VGVWGNDATDVYAVGPFGVALHSNGGGTWDLHVQTSPHFAFTGVWASGPDDVYAGTAVCGNGCSPTPILRAVNGGASWVKVATVEDLAASIWGASAADIFFIDSVPDQSQVNHTADRFATVQAVRSFDGPPLPSQVIGTADGRRLSILLGDGSHEESSDGGVTWSDPIAAPPGFTFATAELFVGNDLWIIGDGGAARASADGGWVAISGAPTGIGTDLRAIWASSPGDIWAAGACGRVFHGQGDDKLVEVPSPTSQNIRAIWGTGPDNIYFVGEGGTILHRH
jgi:hypothetical protein